MSLPPRILLATGNKHKITEMRAILANLLPAEVELLSLDQIGMHSPPDEIEKFSTSTANARAKAEWCRDKSGLPCIADDSGICIDALGGAPGIRSARWAGAEASDADRNARLLEELERVKALTVQQRRGFYACSAAYAPLMDQDAVPLKKASYVTSAFGTMQGYVLSSVSNSANPGGFGYDPIFYSFDLGMSVAEAPANVKNLHSHRALALQRLIAAIF